MILPKKVGTAIDKVYGLQVKVGQLEEELSKTKLAKDIVKARNNYQEGLNLLMDSFAEEELNQAAGKKGIAEIKRTNSFKISDRNLLEEYVYENQALDILQNRLSVNAVKERIEDGNEVPGIFSYEKVELKIKELK